MEELFVGCDVVVRAFDAYKTPGHDDECYSWKFLEARFNFGHAAVFILPDAIILRQNTLLMLHCSPKKNFKEK